MAAGPAAERWRSWSAEIIRKGLERTTWLKVNDEEPLILNRNLFNGTKGLESFAANVLDCFPAKGVLVTCGAAGCVVFETRKKRRAGRSAR